ncbi:hypothetical protein VCHA53O466_40052 [Vibrio chagasii]|nr:hypothetical protein VCHA53O466_40052 [Vibrio chagasii]
MAPLCPNQSNLLINIEKYQLWGLTHILNAPNLNTEQGDMPK